VIRLRIGRARPWPGRRVPHGPITASSPQSVDNSTWVTAKRIRPEVAQQSHVRVLHVGEVNSAFSGLLNFLGTLTG
jgi:hypothetical protein